MNNYNFTIEILGMMINQNIKYSIYIAIIIMTGCSTNYYYPTYQNIPVNNKSKELKGDYFISKASEGFSLSYSVTNNIGSYINLNTFNNYDFKDGAQIMDIGFYLFEAKEISDKPNINLTYSMAAAYGFGQYNRQRDYYELDIHRIVIQPSFAITTKIFDIGFSGRFSYVDYKLNRYKGEEFDSHYTQLHDIGKKPFYFFEPGFFIGLGYKGIKLNFHRLKLNKLNDAKILYYEDTAYLCLSLKFDIDKLLHK